jgi:hypothetical protein
MGGYGSGRWHYHTARSTVGSSLFITPKILRQGCGSVHWNCNGESSGWIRYRLTEYGVMLDYKVGVEPVTEPIRIERGQVGFMENEWFLCPLLKPNGILCNLRCRKLYCPPGAKYFGCRECYNLTYDSCNESHKYDGMYSRLALEMGTSMDFVRRTLNWK